MIQHTKKPKSFQGNIKILFDNEFDIFKSRCKDLVSKSNTWFDDQIKHLQEELKSQYKIINQTLLDNTSTNTKLQSRTNIVNKLIDVSLDTKKSCNIDT